FVCHQSAAAVGRDHQTRNAVAEPDRPSYAARSGYGVDVDGGRNVFARGARRWGRRRDVIEEAAVFVIADYHRGLLPDLWIRGENPQQVHNSDRADRGRQGRMLAFDDRWNHP